LGYNTQSKGYRVYNLQTKKLVISRDVEIDENASWNWEEEKVVKSNTLVPVQHIKKKFKKRQKLQVRLLHLHYKILH